MIAKRAAQRLVQKMGRGMVGPDRRATAMIDFELHRFAAFERAAANGDVMRDHLAAAHALGIRYLCLIVFILEPPQPAVSPTCPPASP